MASTRLRVRRKTREKMACLLAGDQTGGDRPRGYLSAQRGRRSFARYQPLTGEELVRLRSGRRFPRVRQVPRWRAERCCHRSPQDTGSPTPRLGHQVKAANVTKFAQANEAMIRALSAWFRPRLRSPVHVARIHARSTTARRPPLGRRRLLTAPAHRSPDGPIT